MQSTLNTRCVVRCVTASTLASMHPVTLTQRRSARRSFRSPWQRVSGYSLGDVPHLARVVEEDESVGRGYVMERRFLLVAEEDVGRPDLVPHEVLELDLLRRLPVEGSVVEARVRPLLPQVHVERVVLQGEQCT